MIGRRRYFANPTSRSYSTGAGAPGPTARIAAGARLRRDPWLDEAHYARRGNPQRGTRADPNFGTLYRLLADLLRGEALALLLATATPMQLDPIEATCVRVVDPPGRAVPRRPESADRYYPWRRCVGR